MATFLGDSPAIFALQIRQQPQHQTRSMASRLVTGKPGPDAIHQRAERIQPTVGIYAERSGQRRAFLCLHNQR
jgi:hypothetical protein